MNARMNVLLEEIKRRVSGGLTEAQTYLLTREDLEYRVQELTKVVDSLRKAHSVLVHFRRHETEISDLSFDVGPLLGKAEDVLKLLKGRAKVGQWRHTGK